MHSKQHVIDALAASVPTALLRKAYEVLEPDDHSIVLNYWSAADYAEYLINRAQQCTSRPGWSSGAA